MIRLRAIGYALFYGLAPWWVYETTSHYAPVSYLTHLRINLALIARWALFLEREADREFEREINGNG